MNRTAVVLLLAALFVAAPASAKLASGHAWFFTGIAKPTAMYRTLLELRGNEKTTINVTGTGGDIDCYLYEGDFKAHNATLVVRDVTNDDGCSLSVTPTKAGPWTLLVQNTATKDERYIIVID